MLGCPYKTINHALANPKIPTKLPNKNNITPNKEKDSNISIVSSHSIKNLIKSGKPRKINNATQIKKGKIVSLDAKPLRLVKSLV